MTKPPDPTSAPAATGGSNTGPRPHEDLTIAELLETMRVPSQDRPGQQCFRDGNDRNHWISEASVSRFVTASGALHPSNYLHSHGTDWEARFFELRTRNSPQTPHKTMKRQPATGSAGQAAATLDETLKPLGESAAAVYGAMCEETRELVSRASEKIRKHPVPAVVGAAIFGAAACYLIVSGRREEHLLDRLDCEPLAEAGDTIHSTLRSLYDHLKFW